MSFSARRVPRRFRLAAERELRSQTTAPRRLHRAVAKRRKRTRRFFRRSGWLLEERTRVASERGWLETHIWHAKRMRMIRPSWGGVLAWAPCDRGLRSFWKCITRTCGLGNRLDGGHVCAIYDASWYRVVEVIADHPALAGMLGNEVMMRMQSATIRSGMKRLVDISIYDGRESLIAAQAELVYKPRVKGERPRLWLFLHPASVAGVLALLQDDRSASLTTLIPEKRTKDQETRDGFVTTTAADTADASFTEKEAFCLSDGMVRFECYGSRSTDALYRVLSNANASGPGWISFEMTANQCISADSAPSNWLLQIECDDPRVHFPPKLRHAHPKAVGTTAERNRVSLSDGSMINAFGCYSPSLTAETQSPEVSLFDASTRAALREPVPERLIHERRHATWRRRLVYHTIEQVENSSDPCIGSRPRTSTAGQNKEARGIHLTGITTQRVPLLLFQRPSCSRRRIDCGWDLILPRGWAMAFWNSLIYAGARAVGLR